jgi:hypothetical protein
MLYVDRRPDIDASLRAVPGYPDNGADGGCPGCCGGPARRPAARQERAAAPRRDRTPRSDGPGNRCSSAGYSSSPAHRASVSGRPWLSTSPMTTSTPSFRRLLAAACSILKVLPTPGEAPRKIFSPPRPSRRDLREQCLGIRAIRVRIRHCARPLGPSASSARFSRSTLTRGCPSTPSSGGSTCAVTSSADLCLRQTAHLGHPRHLHPGRLRADVRVDARARGGDQIHRDRSPDRQRTRRRGRGRSSRRVSEAAGCRATDWSRTPGRGHTRPPRVGPENNPDRRRTGRPARSRRAAVALDQTPGRLMRKERGRDQTPIKG